MFSALHNKDFFHCIYVGFFKRTNAKNERTPWRAIAFWRSLCVYSISMASPKEKNLYFSSTAIL